MSFYISTNLQYSRYKRVFPELGAFEPEDPDNPPTLNGFTSRKGPATRRKPNARVSSQVAPQTMFRRNEGYVHV